MALLNTSRLVWLLRATLNVLDSTTMKALLRATLRIIMALAAVEDLELHSVDITSAFTNGDLDEKIYMKQPEGFHVGSVRYVDCASPCIG
jgi:hypothetical protein